MTSDDLQRLDGMHVGLLDAEELKAFDEACESGLAYRSYEGVGGFMGLPKVRFYQTGFDKKVW